MHGYWLEFSAVAATHLIAVASPGPDFAIVLRQSLVFGLNRHRFPGHKTKVN